MKKRIKPLARVANAAAARAAGRDRAVWARKRSAGGVGYQVFARKQRARWIEARVLALREEKSRLEAGAPEDGASRGAA